MTFKLEDVDGSISKNLVWFGWLSGCQQDLFLYAFSTDGPKF